METRARYIGTAVEGQYQTAMVTATGDGWVFAQFDEWGDSNLNHGWHRFPQRDFVSLEGYPELPEIPSPAAKPTPQKGRQVFYGVAMSSREVDTQPPELHLRGRTTRPYIDEDTPASWAGRIRNPCDEVYLRPQHIRPEGEPIITPDLAARVAANMARDFSSEFQTMWEAMMVSDEELAS